MKISVPVILMACFCAVGCQKELSVENNGTNPVPTGIGDSIYLDKVIEIWDGSDTTITQFNYDNLKRVASINEIDYSGGATVDTSLTKFLYNGSDSLPYKYTSLYYETWPLQTIYSLDYDTTFLSWDTQKRLKLDSSIDNYTSSGGSYSNYITITSIQYLPGIIVYNRVPTKIASFPGTGGFELPTNDTAWLDGNNNIIRDVEYDVYGAGTPPQDLVYSGTYTFDNKPSPFSTLNIFKVLNTNHGHKAWFTPQVNNYLTFHSEESTYFTFSFIVQNFYNAKGQLVKAIGNDPINNSTNERYFFYKAL